MIASQDAMRRLGWAALFAVAAALLFGMSLVVNAVRSEVRGTELKILAVKREMLYLDTEFETRANQKQLEAWNDVDFGYVAPTAGQYVDSAGELAMLGKPSIPAPTVPSAAAPVRMAAAGEQPAVARATVEASAAAPKPAKLERAKSEQPERAKPTRLAQADQLPGAASSAKRAADKAKPAKSAEAKAAPESKPVPAKAKPTRSAAGKPAPEAKPVPPRTKPIRSASAKPARDAKPAPERKLVRQASAGTRLAAAEVNR